MTDQTVKALKETAVKLGVNGVTTFLGAQAPFTKLPVISTILNLIVTKILDIAVNKTELGSFIVHTDKKVDGQVEDFEEAHKNRELASPLASKEEIEKLEQDKINAARALLKFTH